MSGYDERARHDEHGRHGDDDEQEQHAGNGTVNHGPSENSGPEESGPSDTQGRPAERSPDGPSDESPGTPLENASGDASEKTSDDAPTKASGKGSGDGSAKGSGSLPGDVPDVSSSGDSSDGSSDDSGTESASPEPGRAGGSGADGPGLPGPGFGAGLGADDSGADGSGDDGSGDDGSATDVFGSDELALRRLLHQAVEEIEPTDGTLDHLRRAVPARRARKRQALVGMAAAALFIGTAVPALVHVSNSTGPNADPSVVGKSSATQGGANEGKEASSGNGSGGSGGSSKGSGKGDKKGDTGKGKGGDGGTSGAQPTNSTAVSSTCTTTQLIAGSGGAGAPDAAGVVYGTFTVTNVSTTGCTVVGDGSVSPIAVGAADQSKLSAVPHVAGDAASGLPDPSTYASSLVLQPGQAYYVKFAWVPSETCPTSGGSGGGDPSPDPTPTENPSGGSGGTSEGATGEETQLMRADGTVDGSVSVSYAAEGGAPAASTTVPNACAGTVIRTGVLAGS
ncbi:hypothetical protein OHS59_24510 [Streptomyces sp. NBC_00414]|uniref:hypothetical protein n=1 Tax=Streptomyces sp. NBC_00414 TaxID=2975739 RepID=UPI002E1BC7FF